jgi:hypothetical protein
MHPQKLLAFVHNPDEAAKFSGRVFSFEQGMEFTQRKLA